jgi:Bifunctional DNA primase/polymerase, N-terminal/Primase C terminal 1 (PriCT-1)
VGLMCGPSSGITEVDVDSKDERVLADALGRHGDTPIIIRTASGKYKAWYRHNGEARRIRPWPGLPLDVLGARGFTIAPLSFNASLSAQYQFISGRLDDLDRLPVMCHAPEPKRSAPKPSQRSIASPLSGMVEGDGRNTALFHAIGPAAREIYAEGGTRDRLFDLAMSHNRESDQPMAVEEVNKVVGQVWRYTVDGMNYIGERGAILQDYVVDSFSGDADAFYLLAFLRTHELPTATFWIANGLADRLGWTRQRLVVARNRLIDLGYVRQITRPWQGNPAVYGWGSKFKGV